MLPYVLGQIMLRFHWKKKVRDTNLTTLPALEGQVRDDGVPHHVQQVQDLGQGVADGRLVTCGDR